MQQASDARFVMVSKGPAAALGGGEDAFHLNATDPRGVLSATATANNGNPALQTDGRLDVEVDAHHRNT